MKISNLEKTTVIIGKFDTRSSKDTFFSGRTNLKGKTIANLGFENNISELFNSESKGKLNGFIYSGVGAQFNFRGSAKALFFEIVYRFGLSRFNYRGNDGSNDLNIRNSNLVFSFGVRF